METSDLFRLDARDLGKGLIVAIGGAVASGIYTAVQSGLSTGHVAVNWSVIWISALGAGLGYINKQFFTAGTVVVPKPQQ